MNLLNTVFGDLFEVDEQEINDVLKMCKDILTEAKEICNENNILIENWLDFDFIKNKIVDELSENPIDFSNLTHYITDVCLGVTLDSISDAFYDWIDNVEFRGYSKNENKKSNIEIVIWVNGIENIYEYGKYSIKSALIETSIEPLQEFFHEQLGYDFSSDDIIQSIANSEFSFVDVYESISSGKLSTNIVKSLLKHNVEINLNN